MRVIGKCQVKIFVVLPCKHGVASIDPAGEESHAFVLHCLPVKGEDTKIKEICGLNQLWQNDSPVVGRIRCVVGHASIVFYKTNEAGILNTVALVRRDGKN